MRRSYANRIWNNFLRITRGILSLVYEIVKAMSGPVAMVWKDKFLEEDY